MEELKSTTNKLCEAMNKKRLLDEAKNSSIVKISAQGDFTTLPRSIYIKLMSNPYVRRYIGDVAIHNDRIYINLPKNLIQDINMILSGEEISDPIHSKYYGLLKRLHIGHKWLFRNTIWVEAGKDNIFLKDICRYDKNEEVSFEIGDAWINEKEATVIKRTGNSIIVRQKSDGHYADFSILFHGIRIVIQEMTIDFGSSIKKSFGSSIVKSAFQILGKVIEEPLSMDYDPREYSCDHDYVPVNNTKI